MENILNKTDKLLMKLIEMPGRKVTLGNFILAIREDEGISCDVIANVMGITTKYLLDIEDGTTLISPREANKYAIRLGYAPSTIIKLCLQDMINLFELPYIISVGYKDE